MLNNFLPFYIQVPAIQVNSCDLAFDSFINDCCDNGTVDESALKKNEIGRKIAVNVGEDISDANIYEIILTHNKFTLTVGAGDGVIRPKVDLTFTPCGETVPVTYLANEYLFYVTEATDIQFAGEWQGRSHIQQNTDDFFGKLQTFFVDE